MTISPYSTFFWRGDNAQPMLVRRRFRSANGVRIRIIVTDADGDDIVEKPTAPTDSVVRAAVRTLFDGTDADIRARTPLTRGR